ncbi:MAG: hypothetical protein JOZ21_13680 [Verrucomicrobia bacterium]|nr:hypothetical protein [Verrucomicrobiota bacterium]
MKRNQQWGKHSLAEIQDSIKELRPKQRATLCEWLNGYEGNALIFLSASKYVPPAHESVSR